MTTSKYIKISVVLLLVGMSACTKLKETYTATLPPTAAAQALGTDLLLSFAYNDIPVPFVNQDRVFSLEENSTDESLVPTRGGDWDDNGVWRVIHNHTWNADHDQLLQVYNLLNKLNFDATNVLAFNPTKGQAAEARFLRAFAMYYIFDLYNQVAYRNPGENLLNAPKVLFGDSAVNFIISELTAVLPDLPAGNNMTKANPDACRAMLMRCYLNKGAFLNRANPTFDPADMQKVIDLGNAVISSGKYKYMDKYFANFNVNNGSSTEGIFAFPSVSGTQANNGGVQARWMMTFHYNEYDAQAPNAGWNGFSTMSDFYNTFSLGGTTNYSLADTLLDTRIGRRTKSDSVATSISGIRPGFLVGQQFDQNGVALKDRKGNPLAFDPAISSTMIEQGNNLEITGIRVAKYVPDFSDPGGKYYSSTAGNWMMLIRYPDVVLMTAEALMRKNGETDVTALSLINGLRTARGASTVAAMPLVNTSNVDDPKTLLAERGRELYWESVRRTDLIRFKVFTLPWQYKPSDDPKNLVYPVPNQALAVNPNLKQNPGYTK
jgi:hypothetical protein